MSLNLRPLFGGRRLIEVLDLSHDDLVMLARECYGKLRQGDSSYLRELRFVIAFMDVEPDEINPDPYLQIFLQEREAAPAPALTLVAAANAA